MIQLGGRSCVIFSLSLVSHETGKATRMCLAEMYNTVRVGNNLSDKPYQY